jgi:hypothetical protein
MFTKLDLIDLDSIRSMKQHMLRQIPGYDMLLLPPYDTFRQKAENSMDHLVRPSFTFKLTDTFYRLALCLVCLRWDPKHLMSQKIWTLPKDY